MTQPLTANLLSGVITHVYQYAGPDTVYCIHGENCSDLSIYLEVFLFFDNLTHLWWNFRHFGHYYPFSSPLLS